MPDSPAMRLHATFLLSVAGLSLGSDAAVRGVTRLSSQPRASAADSSEKVSRAASAVPCAANLRRAELEPLGPGPARLATIRCLDLPRGQDYRLPPIVSPDGQSVALWGNGQVSPLDVVAFDGSSGFRLPNRVTFRDFGSGIQDDRQGALAWRSNSSGLWSVEQKVVSPSGWALSGLTPTLIDRNGDIRRFSPPKHAAGPLDALAWSGSDGLAVVQFGTRGDRYRPKHEDPSPTLAMVDVPRGRILHTLTAADFEALKFRAGSYNGFGIFDVSVVQMRNGRQRALLQFERVVDRSHQPASGSTPAQDRYLPATWSVWT